MRSSSVCRGWASYGTGLELARCDVESDGRVGCYKLVFALVRSAVLRSGMERDSNESGMDGFGQEGKRLGSARCDPEWSAGIWWGSGRKAGMDVERQAALGSCLQRIAMD